MSGPVDLDLIKATLAARIDSLVPQLYPAAQLDGKHWVLGDIDGNPGQSLRITRVGQFAGTWTDFNPTGKRSGSLLDLIAGRLYGGSVTVDVVRYATEWCGLGAISPADRQKLAARDRDAREKAAAVEREKTAKKRRQAQAIWLTGAKNSAGTPADLYLQGRAIDFTALGRFPGALRFAAEVYNAERDAYLPAMLAYVADGQTGQQLAVHRTYLNRSDAGLWVKDWRLKDAKKSLGPFRSGHIPIWRGEHGDKRLCDLPKGTWIATAEGIENAGSIAMSRPELRVIAHIAMDNLGALDLPDNIGGLLIGVDNDPTDAALNANLARLEDRGFAFQLVRPPKPHKDMNDWARALKAGVTA